MNKDDTNSTFDFDDDPEFNDNFSKNLDKVFSDLDIDTNEPMAQEDETFAAEEQMTENDITAEGEAEKEMLETEENDDFKVEIDDELSDIHDSIAKQICEEMDTEAAAAGSENNKRPRSLKIRIGILSGVLGLVLIGCFLGFTKPGNKLLMRMGVNLGGSIWASGTNKFGDDTKLTDDTDHLDDDDLNSTGNEYDPSQIVWPQHPGDGRKEEGVYNILLIGEEAIGQGTSRGRTDAIVIATMNTVEKKIKLTSILRDTLVQIPGYNDNKINSAYEKGGRDLLYETIAKNFDLRLDGCVLVNFSDFEKLIDQLGGVEITLTATEARYLNSTNYISNPAYRNVREGKQVLNGNQALGYSRVRKRSTITGRNNDYGRTDRHRIVLNAIFDKYKTKSKLELASMMPGILPMLTTDIDNKTFEILLNTFFEMGTMEIEQMRIPLDGTFTENIKVRGMDVLVPDLNKNVDALHKFIFGENSVATDSTTAANSTTTTNGTTLN